tara:strand:+ start:101149 stop:101370 length:222 start_codon:yes stop_codon:yes gene_type:complete
MLFRSLTKMKKIAAVFASATLLALAACGEKPAEEANNAAVVENVVDNAAEAVENASNAVENASNAVENTANAM